MTPLPIDDVLPELREAIGAQGRAVLQAPPGAGKTTRVPLALLDRIAGRIVMLEPRRLAARAAAERMAETLGEPVGRTVGYRMRGDARVSAATRIEVVTEGLLIRMVQADPGLDGIGCVIFDEFHERGLDADLALALVWEARQALRPDLAVIVMSATLDAQPVAAMLDAPLITSTGRMFPVEERWLDRPLPEGRRWDAAMAALIARAVDETDGGVLAFLPGEGEIRRVARLLDVAAAVRPLFGAMPFADQRAAIAGGGARKVVLATAIAETALTIEDVRVVVDGGLARRARFDPGSGMTRLVTERVSRAEAAQRTGRAGRVAPGVCYRLWTRGQDGALPAYPPAGIETADLAGLALELAIWGANDAAALPFLTPPPESALAGARALLEDLGALADGHATAAGRAMAAMPVHPRLAHMLRVAGPDAADLAALLSERDILRDRGADLTLRLRALRDPGAFGVPSGVAKRIRTDAARLRRLAGKARAGLDPAQMAALAYPDRVALRRAGDAPRWLLSGGKEAVMDATDPLSSARLLVVTDTDGDPRAARIRAALPIAEGALRTVLGGHIDWHDVCEWSRRDGRVIARRQERLGSIVLDDRAWADAPADAVARAMLIGVRELGLAPDPAARRFLARVALAGNLFDTTEAALLDSAVDWLLPWLDGMRSAGDWKRFDLLPALRARLDHAQMQRLDREVPGHIETPLGRRIAVDYDGDAPQIAVRVQEMFGMTTHPQVAGRPLRIVLLSPGSKPVQVTMDLPGFWTGSYADVRRDMRARYPRHPWPDDPTQAEPTLRAKRRGT
nr:ATP-dependent helicase HrpB [Oceaniovalibus guishaninsula]